MVQLFPPGPTSLGEKKKTILNTDPNSGIYLFHESCLYLFTGTLTDHLQMDTITLGQDTWALLDSPNPATSPNPILTATPGKAKRDSSSRDGQLELR